MTISKIDCLQKEDVGFGEYLKRFRKRLGLTRKELATKVHCSVSTIKRYESHPHKSTDTGFLFELTALINEEFEKIENIPGLKKIPCDMFTKEGLAEFQRLIKAVEPLKRALRMPFNESDLAARNHYCALVQEQLQNSFQRLVILQNVQKLMGI